MAHVLDGKVVIITGASTGIGAAAARALNKLGCRLTLAARSADKLEALAAELGANALAVPTDITVPADITNMVDKTIAQFGRVDVLFANAGIYIPGKWGARLEDIVVATDDGPMPLNHANHTLVTVEA